MAKISVIVPCYNNEKYIGRCISSLLGQTLKDIDIIVIDDGSNDGSLEVIRSFDDPRVRCFTKENNGIAEARNFGVDKVNSPYFGFLDSDDYCAPDMFEKMVNAIENEGSDICVSNFTWDFENDSKKNYVQKEGPYKPGKDMMKNLFAVLWNKVYRTDFVRSLDYQFPVGYRYEDASFLYKMCSHVKKISFVDEAFVGYVQRPGSITHTYNEKVKDMVHVFEDLEHYYQEHGLIREYQDELEFIFIRFFLGNSFLRAAKIKDQNDRKMTLDMSWDILNRTFPKWRNNCYISGFSPRNIYYRLVDKWNYGIIAGLYGLFVKE